jgi:hypothetical protein
MDRRDAMFDRSFAAENGTTRDRLRQLVARLSDVDLARPLGDGWTAATALAHLAFWDCRLRLLLDRWKRDGVGSPALDEDTVNEALREICAALPARTAGDLAVAAAEAVDRTLEQAHPDLIAQIEKLGIEWPLRRALHRQEHLDLIENALCAPERD